MGVSQERKRGRVWADELLGISFDHERRGGVFACMRTDAKKRNSRVSII